MTKISNGIISVEIADKGAEIQSIYNHTTGLEYMWNGDAAFWGKKSPVLFPIVGGLKNNTYQFEGKNYTLGRHGFARDMIFNLSHQSENTLTYTLVSNEATLTSSPFQFIFSVSYTISENKLSCKYIVENTGNNNMFFSCGAHPAFKVPLTEDTDFSDWHLQFSTTENAGKWPLSKEGLLLNESVECLQNANQLPLTKALFYSDALVFKNLQSTAISIVSTKSKHGLTMHFPHFPYFGIWSTKDANFVCLEPWCGIADSINATGNLKDKEGIHILEPNKNWDRTWSVEVF